MRIVNFNSPNTWIAWKKTYIDDLNIKITSLWNYMMWHNPPFRVLNSINQEVPVNLDDEDYKYRIEVSSEDGGVKFHVYIPSKLQYHQGFYNDSLHGDAALGYLDSTENLHLISDPSLTINKGQEGYELNSDKQLPKLDFPSGYVCISNIQPEGSNNESNELRHNIANYLIYPLGNGSYFDLSAHGSTWVAQYQQNDMDNYADRMLVNLSSAIRYILNTKNDVDANTGTWSSLNVGIASNNADYDPYIQDIDGNIWIGKEDLVLEVYNNYELVICDSKTTITQEVQHQTITHRALLTSNIKKSGYTIHSI